MLTLNASSPERITRPDFSYVEHVEAGLLEELDQVRAILVRVTT